VPPPRLDEVRLPPPALPGTARAALVAALGDDAVRTGAADRIRHTRGKSTVDLLRLRAGDADEAPDAVVCPGSHEEVQAALEICAAHRVAVVPFGGGTSVVGGLAPARAGFAAVVALDLVRLDRLLAVDRVSRLATVEAGVRGPAVEELLAGHGLTLGHFPQSYELATIGGFAATRSSGQFSAGYGRFDDMVTGLRVATPSGELRLGRAPRSAAGPDLRQLLLGSEGTLGVVTEVTLRVRPATAEPVVEGWGFPSFDDGLAAVRLLAQDGPVPLMVRLSDEVETAMGTTPAGDADALALVAHDADDEPTRAGVGRLLSAVGGVPLGPEVGRAWLRTRYDAPYLRDALLGAGALAETLETAAYWSVLPQLYVAVRTALTETLAGLGTPPAVLCHVSHVYATGASLYFTVVCAQAEDPVAQWRRAKEAANRAVLDAGGTITHHHGVGTDHAAAYAEEVGPLGLAALRAVKASLDPVGILNPGILLGPA
jgi:alkyldihydroxyacetonephosphate synthase